MKNYAKMLVLFAASVSSIATSHAQAAADSPSGSSVEQSGAMLEDIIVTARKREERLQDVPVAISALSGDSLRQRGAFDIKAVASLSPGVFYRAADRRVLPHRRPEGKPRRALHAGGGDPAGARRRPQRRLCVRDVRDRPVQPPGPRGQRGRQRIARTNV